MFNCIFSLAKSYPGMSQYHYKTLCVLLNQVSFFFGLGNEVSVLAEPVLNCLLYALQQPQLACAAATALQSICAACRTHMSQHFSGLVQIVQSMDTFCISNDAAIGLLKGVAIILGRLPHEQINDSMKQICLVQVNPLCELVHVSIFQMLFIGLRKSLVRHNSLITVRYSFPTNTRAVQYMNL